MHRCSPQPNQTSDTPQALQVGCVRAVRSCASLTVSCGSRVRSSGLGSTARLARPSTVPQQPAVARLVHRVTAGILAFAVLGVGGGLGAGASAPMASAFVYKLWFVAGGGFRSVAGESVNGMAC